jgi:sialic acid synthase SpsE
MDVEDLKTLVENINILDKAYSVNEINYQQCEEIPRKQARRSIVLNKNLKK